MGTLKIYDVRWPNAMCWEVKRKSGKSALITSNEIAKTVAGIFPRINHRLVNKNIIQIYAPTSQSTQEKIEQFYKDLNKNLHIIKKLEGNIIF